MSNGTYIDKNHLLASIAGSFYPAAYFTKQVVLYSVSPRYRYLPFYLIISTSFGE